MSTASTSAVLDPGAAGARTRRSGLAGLFAICFISSLFGGVVSTLMSVYLPVAVRDLLGPVTDKKLNDVSAAINSVFIFGWMFGGVIWGLICDRIGRARTVMLSTFCYGLFTVLTAAATSWWLVTGCRFLSGFGVGGVLVTTTMLVSESWSGKSRAVALGILSISIPVGIFSAGLINFLLPEWRLAFLTGVIPLLAAGVALFRLKETDRWKTREQPDKARLGFLSGPYRNNLLTGSVIFGTMLIGMWAIFSWLPTWVQSLSGLVDAQHERGTSMMMMGAGGLAGGFVSGWVVHAIGLRRTMLTCFAVCFGMSFLLFKLNGSFNGLAYAEIAILAVFFGISQGALSVYIPELFPAAVGAAATGFCFNVGRLFTATAVFFVGALVSWLGGYGNTLFIFSFIFLIGLLATIIAGKK
jgi:predicted MFS family arabinose efflux permease